MAQESNTERQVLAERKDSFTGEASYPVEKLDARPQEPTSHCGSGGKGFLKGGFQGCGGRGGGCVRSIILKLVVQLPDQHHPDRFGYELLLDICIGNIFSQYVACLLTFNSAI